VDAGVLRTTPAVPKFRRAPQIPKKPGRTAKGGCFTYLPASARRSSRHSSALSRSP
jgi:hypothetical protein